MYLDSSDNGDNAGRRKSIVFAICNCFHIWLWSGWDEKLKELTLLNFEFFQLLFLDIHFSPL